MSLYNIEVELVSARTISLARGAYLEKLLTKVWDGRIDYLTLDHNIVNFGKVRPVQE